ncbi:DUF2383 domain-containing protein [Brevifollis gellanilyticus]|uniref:DUF2383 domain-containing protein n=1 Tax=Brevifollis gellanilyticus TaxID=748831 RepID=A0A512MAC9_9BACT|nr:DUF2383 domain-containing protein [Brevifollis gellanilyticus]GEP43692.1 hypothetical protein BGE01nite_29830 [Brevifollis gellanilyticus]
MIATDPTIDICNELLRGEVSAVETYTQAIEAFDDNRVDLELERIRGNHQQNVYELQKLAAELGAEPSTGSGVWGGFVQALEGAATLFGESPALRILQAGESHGISQYENALANEDVTPEFKTLIRKTLLPHLSTHLIELQQRRDRVN